jgi:hypothetical protein
MQWKAVETMLGRLAPGGRLLVFDHDCKSGYGRRMGFKKFVTRHLRIPLVPRFYCNAGYPPLGVFANRIADRGLKTEIREAPINQKFVLIAGPSAA